MKETQIAWIPEIASDFEIRRVKDVFEVSKNKSWEKNPVILSLARDSVKVRDISKNEGQLAETYEGYNIVKAGDLLLNPMDLYSGANCNVSEIEGVISPAYSNLRAKVKINPKYFDYYFKYQYWTMAMFAHGKGVSFDNRWTINNDALRAYEIPFPTCEEQNQIVSFIKKKENQINSLIQKEYEQIEKLKAYKSALISEVVTKGLDPSVSMKKSGNWWLDEVPVHWSVEPLKTWFSFGKGLPITKENLVEKGAPVISYGQIHSKTNTGTRVSAELIRYVPNHYLESNPGSLCYKNDFLMADTSEDLDGCGNSVFMNISKPIFAGYHTLILRPKKTDFNYKYFAYLFKSDEWRSQIRSRVSGVKLFSISRRILESSTLLIPTSEEQNSIVEYLDAKCSKVDEIISIKQKKINLLNSYRKSLIYEYVIGKKEA